MTRRASVVRKTTETDVRIDLVLDGSGHHQVETGIPFFDHMLAQVARHGLFDLEIRAQGDLAVDHHHTIEDVGIALGEAFTRALGDKVGIRRYGWASVPMDDALASVALDISGRPYLAYRAPQLTGRVGEFDADLVKEFCRALANHLRANLHVRLDEGENVHHMAEAIFKALGRALDAATSRDPRVTGVPSTKGHL